MLFPLNFRLWEDGYLKIDGQPIKYRNQDSH